MVLGAKIVVVVPRLLRRYCLQGTALGAVFVDAPFCSDHLTHLNRKGGQGTVNSSMFSLKSSANLMPKFAKDWR